MNIVNFHYESVEFRLDNHTNYQEWLIKLALEHQKVINEINFIFCDDEYLIQINVDFLDHNTYTDIITFPYSYDPIESDIYISIDRIKENASNFDVSFEIELHRVMAHGLLHLMGFNDKTKEEKAIIRNEENKAILLI